MLLFYSNIKDFIWCQEEPISQEAWLYVQNYLIQFLSLNANLHHVRQVQSVAIAVGYM